MLKAAGGVTRVLTQIYPEIITGEPQHRHHYTRFQLRTTTVKVKYNSMIVPGGDATTVNKMLGSPKSISCL